MFMLCSLFKSRHSFAKDRAVLLLTHLPRLMTRLRSCNPHGDKVTWLRVPDIAPSARKHGITDDDMRHAQRNPIRVEHLDDGLTMFIGPRPDGDLLEVGVVDGDNGPVIVHAMRARARYLHGRG